MKCHLCGRDNIPTYAHAYRRVTGYIRDRGAGGANQLTLRQETGELACEECISKAKRNISPEQESLL